MSACLFGAIPIFTLIATRAGVTLQMFLVGRYAIGALGLLLIAGGPSAFRLPRRNATRLIVIGGIGQVLVTWFGLGALRYVPAATAGFLFYTFPAWITIWAAVRRTEPLTRWRVLALVLALFGVGAMAGTPPAGTVAWQGVALALAASVVYACYVPLMRDAQTNVSPVVSSALISSSAATLYFVVSLFTSGFVLPAQPIAALSAIVGVGVLSTIIAFQLFFRGLDALGPVRTAIISTVEPFCTAILAALFLDQPLTFAAIAGGILIASAVALLQSDATAARPAAAAQ